MLSRIVLHPTYRGAGLAAAFVRASCATCPVPWIESLSVMGHLNPFFEKAGFRRVGTVRKSRPLSPRACARLYGGSRLTQETLRKSLHSEPVYYLFDNRHSPCLLKGTGTDRSPATDFQIKPRASS